MRCLVLTISKKSKNKRKKCPKCGEHIVNPWKADKGKMMAECDTCGYVADIKKFER